MSTWKKYGGISHVEAQNSISAYSLSVDLFTLRQAYFGTFDICGELHVSGNALVDHDVRSNNVTVYNDISCNQLFVNSNSNHLGDMNVTGNLSVLVGNVRIMNGNIDLSNNLYLSKKLFLGNSGLYVNGTDVIGNIGINTVAPKSALDFQSTQPFMLNVETTNATNYSVLSKTGGGDGAILYTDASVARLDFFVDASANIGTTPDARLAYTPGGNFTIDVSSNTSILSNVSLSNRSSQIVAHVYGETAVIYDNSAGLYQYPAYQNANSTVGNALSLVANDASSITFLNVVTSDKKGIALGGGAYPNNQTRAMGTVGLLDTSGNYTPAVHLVDASSNIYSKFGLGINTYAPELDNYVLNINGSTHMKNGQLTITKQANIEIYKMSLASTNSSYGIAIGSPYTTDASFTDATYKYRQKVYYTTNGGETWNDNSADVTNGLYNTSIEQSVSGAPRYINGVFAYDASLSFLCANGIINYSNSSGARWYGISNVNGSRNYSSIYATGSRVFTADTAGNLLYFDYTNAIYTDFDGLPAINPVTLSVGYTGTPYIHGYGTQLFLATGNSVFQLNNILGTVGFSLKLTNPYGPYRSLYTLDGTNAVAVGSNVITWTNNGFSTSTNINVPGTTFNSVHIMDASNAIAVGNGGTIQYTTNGYATWSVVPPAILNSSGNGNVLTDRSYNLTIVRFININQFYITKTISSYVSATTFGNTSLFHCYVPELFNNANNRVLDVSGTTCLSGDLNVNDGGRIRTNNSTFYLLDTCANVIRMGGEAANVFIGNSVSSTTTVNSALVTKQDASFNGNVVVGGKTQMLGNTTFTNSYVFSSYFDSANSDGSIYIAGLNSAQLGLPVNPGSRNVKMGNFNPTVDMSCNIYIGGPSDAIILGGSVYDNSSLNIGPQIYINYLSMPNSSPHCGIFVGESGVKGAGYMIVSNDMGGFVLKSTKTPNIIKLDVSNLIYNGPGSYNQGLVTLSKLTQGIDVDASYSVGVGTIDVSNVFLKNWALSSTSSNLQTVDTSMSILGNVAIGKSTFIANTKLDVSGNVLVSSRLGVGNTAVNGSYVFDVLGDTNFGGNANITGLVSAMGNVAVNRSMATAGYAVDVSGNTNLTGNLMVSNGAKITSGNMAVYSGNVCINRTLANIGYALDVSGNANVSGNLTVTNGVVVNGGGITATSAQTINFGTNAPSMYGTNIANGTVPDAALTSNVMLLNARQIITDTKYFEVNGNTDHVQFYNNNTPGQSGFIYITTADAIGYFSITSTASLWSISYLGNFMTTGGISAKVTQTIDFSNNAPIMYGNNIALGTIRPASINGLSTAIPGINSTGTIGINKVLSNSGYVLDTSGSVCISNGIWAGPPLTYINIAITPTAITYAVTDSNIFGFNSLGTINISKTNTVLNIPNSLSNNSFTYTPFTYEGNYTFTYTYNYSTSNSNPTMYIYPNSTSSNYGTPYLLGKVNGLSGTISTTIYLSNGLNAGTFAAAFDSSAYMTTISQTLSIKFQPTLSTTSFNYITSGLGVGNGLFINKAVITSGYALDVNGNTNVSGNLTTAGGISATASQTINFGTNAPTMYGTNIATGTIPVAAINGLSSAIAGINSTGNVGINKSSATAGYALDVNGNTNVSGNLTIAGGISATASQTINFGTNAPTMYGTNIANATIPDAAHSANIPKLNASNTFTTLQVFSTPLSDSINVRNNAVGQTSGYFYVNGVAQTGYWNGSTNNWYITSSGDIITIGNINASTSNRTINFGTNAPTMYGTNIATGTIPVAAINGLSSAIAGINSTGNVGINKSSATAGYALDVNGNAYVSGNLTVNNGFTVSSGTVTFPNGSISSSAISGGVNVIGINSVGTIGINKSSASAGYALDVNGNTNVSGNLTTAGGISATASQTINFGTNAPTMYGTNIATNTIPMSAINNLPLYANNTNSNYAFQIPSGSYTKQYQDLSVGVCNSALGQYSLQHITSGIENTAVGFNSLPSLTTGVHNVAVGSNTLVASNGSFNVAIGRYALNGSTNNNNTAIGYFTYAFITTGQQNVSVGASTGSNVKTGNNNTLIGYNTNTSADHSYSTAIGYNSVATGSHQIMLGTSSETVYFPGGISATASQTINFGTNAPTMYGTNIALGTIPPSSINGLSTAIPGINSTGTIGINKSSATAGYALDINGNTNVSGNLSVVNGITVSNGVNNLYNTSTTDIIRAYDNTVGRTSGFCYMNNLGTIGYYTGALINWYINYDGTAILRNVAVNKASVTTGYALDVNGTVLATSYNASSDARLKTHIQPLVSTFDTIQKINAVSFDWKGNGKSDCGFIAQNVFEHLPNMRPDNWSIDIEEPVDASGNPVYYSIDYGKMTPHLWGAVNDLIRDNRRLSQENASLKKRLERIEAALGLVL